MVMSLTFNLGHKVEPMYASESKIRSNTSTELTTIVAPKSVFAQVVELIRHGQALESKYGDISTAPRQFTEKIRTEYRKIDSELRELIGSNTSTKYFSSGGDYILNNGEEGNNGNDYVQGPYGESFPSHWVNIFSIDEEKLIAHSD